MIARHLYHDHDTGHTYWLDGGALLAAPVDRHGVVDLTDAYDVDMFRVDDVARVHRIAAQLAAAEAEAAESAARLSDPGGHVEVIPNGGGSRADRPLVDPLPEVGRWPIPTTVWEDPRPEASL